MAGARGGAGIAGAVTPRATGRGPLMGVSIRTGADSAEKTFLPAPAYWTSSLWDSLSKCRVGSMLAVETFCASGPAGAELTSAAVGMGRGFAAGPAIAL